MSTEDASPPPQEMLLERIDSALPVLRRSERKVAEVILQDPAFASTFTMADLARAADVSEPTVMRFCSSVGCSSFLDLKTQLTQTVAIGLPVTYSALTPQDKGRELTDKVFDHTISSLDRARRNLDADAVENAIATILECKDLFFFGFGASGIIAQDAQQKFPLFGVPCQAPEDYHQQFIAATCCTSGTVAVAISNTGNTVQTVKIARAARQSGATIVAITGQESTLTRMADISLIVRTFEDTDAYTPATSRLAGLVVIDVLATGVALRRPSEHLELLRTMKSKLAAMRHPEPREP